MRVEESGGLSTVGGWVGGPPGELGDGDVSQVLSEASVVRCLEAIPRRDGEEAVHPRAHPAGLETHAGDPPPTATVEVQFAFLQRREGREVGLGPSDGALQHLGLSSEDSLQEPENDLSRGRRLRRPWEASQKWREGTCLKKEGVPCDRKS